MSVGADIGTCVGPGLGTAVGFDVGGPAWGAASARTREVVGLAGVTPALESAAVSAIVIRDGWDVGFGVGCTLAVGVGRGVGTGVGTAWAPTGTARTPRHWLRAIT